MLAVVAQARPEWLYESVNASLGTYTEMRVKGYGRGTPAGAIYQGQARKQAFKDVVSTYTNELDAVVTVTNSVAIPVTEAYYTASVGPRAATTAEMAARVAADAAAAQAAAYAELQAIVDNAAINAAIKQIEAIVDNLSLTRPVTVTSATSGIKTYCVAQEGLGTLAGALASTAASRQGLELLALFSGVMDAGIDAATINSVWAYMVATNQD